MANIKNFGLVGVAGDVQFGKAGPRVINSAGAFQFKDAAGTAFAAVAASDLSATALAAQEGKMLAVDATGKIVTGAHLVTELATKAEVTAATSAIEADITALEGALADEVTARGTAISDEEAARIAGDALKLNLAGGVMTGDLILSTTPTTNSLGAVTKGYVDSLAGGLSWQEPVMGMGATLPEGPVAGQRFINTTDSKMYVAGEAGWDAGTDPQDGFALFDTSNETGYVFSGDAWVQFTGTGQITAGLGMKKTGNRLDVELSATGAITFTPDLTDEGSVLALKLDGATLSMGADGVRVHADVIDSITAAQAAADAAQAAADAAQGDVDATITGAGLAAAGAYVAHAAYDVDTAPDGVSYINGATSLHGADKLLDAAIKDVADGLAALGTGSLAAIQAEIDAVEAAVGLGADGSFTAFADTEYLDASTSVVNSLALLDAALAASVTQTAADIAALTSDDITEGTTNLYFTDARARAAVSVTGVGVAYDSATGVISSNATAAGVTADTIVSRGVDGAIEVGAIQATALALSSLAVGSMVFVGANGVLSTDGEMTYDAATNVLTVVDGFIMAEDAPTAAGHLANKAYVDGSIAAAVGTATTNTGHAIAMSFDGANASLGEVTGFVHRVKIYVTEAAGTGAEVSLTAGSETLVSTADVDSGVAGVYVIEVSAELTATELTLVCANVDVAGKVVIEYV